MSKNANKKLKNKSIIKFLLYLLAVMFIPLIVLGAFVYINSRNEYVNSTTKYIQEQINNVTYNIDKDIIQAESIDDRIKDEIHFYNSTLQKDKGSIVYIQDEVLETVHTLPFNGDLSFFNLIDGYIYSYTIQTINDYLDNLSFASDSFKLEALEKLKFTKSSVVSDLEDDYNYTWYIYSFEEIENESISGFIFFIPDYYFEQILSQIQFLEESQTSVFINETMVYSNHVGKEVVNNSIELTAQSENVKIIYYISANHMTDYLGATLYSILIALAIGILIGLVIIYIQYKPIKDLGLIINSFLIGSSNKNLFTEINLIMNNLIEKNHYVEIDKNNALELNEKIIRKNTLLTLISQNLYQTSKEDIESFNSSIKKSDSISFSYNNYLCVVFHGINLDIQSYYKGENLDFYSIEIVENESTVLIISAKEKSFLAVEAMIGSLLKKTVLEDGFPLSVGVGSFTSKLHHLYTSYKNALTALDYCNSLNKNIVYFSEVNQIDIYSYSACVDIIKSFSSALQTGDTENLLSLSKDIKNVLATTQNALTLHSMCLELIFMCEDSSKIIFNKEEIENFKYNFFNNDFAKNNYSEFLSWVESEIDINKNKDESNEKVQVETSLNVEKIQDYINKNITSNDLCVTFVADHFSTSGSNLSHFYKKHTGTTILDCINTAKMNFVKKMLTETDYSFSKICDMIGYYYPSNLIRKFKSIEGMTPSEYRKRKI